MNLDRAWIASRIPHQGTMCLLDSVQSWDSAHIVCIALSHQSLGNPLRADNRLGICCGIEYAAQAMAVHGELLSNKQRGGSGSGFLTSVREVKWSQPTLDALQACMWVRANRISGNESSVLYSFSVVAENIEILTGRASVLLTATTS